METSGAVLLFYRQNAAKSHTLISQNTRHFPKSRKTSPENKGETP